MQVDQKHQTSAKENVFIAGNILTCRVANVVYIGDIGLNVDVTPIKLCALRTDRKP